VLPVSFGESTVSFCDIGGYRKRGPVQLVCKKSITSWELLTDGKDVVGEIYCLLVDLKILEHEGHAEFQRGKIKIEQATAGGFTL
jgi:hypothetical protein